jgi:carrier protein
LKFLFFIKKYLLFNKFIDNFQLDTFKMGTQNVITQAYAAQEEDTPVNEWVRYGMRLGVSALIHPFEYSKTLMQLGYEPIPSKPGKTLFGNPAMVLPNVFTYTGYIRDRAGLLGCFRGLTPKLFGNIIGSYGSEKVAEKLGLAAIADDETKDDTEVTEEEVRARFIKRLKRDIVIHTSTVIFSHPFHVISVRMMADFIGQTGRYETVFGSIHEICRNDGVLGFFAGLVPRLLCDVSCLVLVSSASFLVNKYVVRDHDSSMTSISQFVFSSILYPLHVVSTCMIVSGSGVTGGIPQYNTWYECFSHLKATNSLKRGSSLFFRYIPHHSIKGKAMYSMRHS